LSSSAEVAQPAVEAMPSKGEVVDVYSPDRGRSFREIVRQQWNFSPPGAVREIEDYVIELPDVTLLDLTIVPDIGNGNARASLLSMRLT
jgi:hypothetical protein